MRRKYSGPYEITAVGSWEGPDSAYVTVRMNTVEKKLNIRKIKPYHGWGHQDALCITRLHMPSMMRISYPHYWCVNLPHYVHRNKGTYKDDWK